MIPKSGSRFSEKTMLQKTSRQPAFCAGRHRSVNLAPRLAQSGQALAFPRRNRARVLPTPLSKFLRSPIASCLKPAVGPVCGSITLRTTKKLLRPLPDFTVSSGLQISLRSLPANKGSGTPTDAHCMKPHRRMRPRAKRRALVCRRSTTALAAATERHRSAPVHALPGTELGRDGRYPPPAVPVQRAL
jgi:hypothetical protein